MRAQALAIASVNDQWGVFSRSRVRLLPHQLWVCRTVNRAWPFRWLVADDVGLGKTIECGLVLMPLIASGRVRRLLILAPAKLVPQWQYRLKDLFDIRLQRYVAEADTRRGDFWGTASQVVASLHTLRGDGRGARQRLLDADPWDLVVVDEAHHLGLDKKTGATLAYGLVADLEARRKINSLLFFTGTPHRGKDFGFFGLMRLVRPDLFDPEQDGAGQLARLPQAMIRNNKAAVTDLQGNRLFQPLTVRSREYRFSEAESRFYRTLSAFILDGRAYAATLDGRAQTARMLVLTTLQKLAASSIAAVRHALWRRRAMLAHVVGHAAADGSAAVGAPDDQATLDEVAEAEEALPGTAAIVLMKDEIERLDDLVALTDEVVAETKIERLVALVRDELPAAEPVLLFTEYKTTQALVVNALHRQSASEAPPSSTATTGSTAWSRRRVATGQSTSRANRLPRHSMRGACVSWCRRRPAAKASICRSAAPCWCTWTCRGTRCGSINASAGCRAMASAGRSPPTSCGTRTPLRRASGTC